MSGWEVVVGSAVLSEEGLCEVVWSTTPVTLPLPVWRISVLLGRFTPVGRSVDMMLDFGLPKVLR
jgi:hypothetical protein